MMTSILALTSLFTIIYTSSKNPMKIAATLLALSVTMALTLSLMKGTSWMPMMFLMLFTGGILMTFMILSSLMPNESFSATNWVSVSTILMVLIGTTQNTAMWNHQSPTGVKWAAESNSTLTLITLVMTIYFFSFLQIIYKDKIPMRSMICHTTKQFCKSLMKNWL